MEYKIKFIQQLALNPEDFERIILLKNQHWNFSIQSQKKWISENIQDQDYHLWFENSFGKIIAYLNIVLLNISLDNTIKKFAGIGNVCVDKKFSQRGLGNLLMNTCNYFIRELQLPAILLCDKELCNFYNKSGWIDFQGATFIQGNIFTKKVMLNTEHKINIIKMDRNF